MSNVIDLKRETLNVAEQNLDSYSQAIIDADIIVPDIKPDIARISKVNAYIVISDTSITADRVKINGLINTEIIFVTDTGNISSMQSEIPFEHAVALKGAAPEMYAESECDVKSIQDSVINSRKISLKVYLDVKTRLTRPQSIDVAVSAEGEDYEMLTKEISTNLTVNHFTGEIPVRDQIDFPSGKNNVYELLSCSAYALPREVRAINNKVIVKGALMLNVLYKSDTPDMALDSLSFELPFTETIDTFGVDESMTAQVRYNLKSITCEPREDSDGDMRMLSVNAVLEAHAAVSKTVAQNVLCDIYNTKFPTEIKKQSATVEKIVADVNSQLILKETINLPHELPEVATIYDKRSKPIIDSVTVETDKVTVSGEIEIYLSYLSTTENSYINEHKCTVQFKCAVDVEGAQPGMSAEADVIVQEMEVAAGLGWNVELKLIADVPVRVIKPVKFDYVVEATQLDPPPSDSKKAYTIKIYFVQPEDTAWTVAKKYRTKISNILKANSLEASETLKPGMQIIIP